MEREFAKEVDEALSEKNLKIEYYDPDEKKDLTRVG